MKKWAVTGMLLIGLALLLIVPAGAGAVAARWITPQRAYSLVRDGSGLWLVDIRGEAAYAAGHIEGALNIPVGLLATKSLPKGKIIVIVDDSLGLRKGREAVQLLRKSGHGKVWLLDGGVPAWRSEGYPVAGKAGGRIFPSVMPDDVAWAEKNRVPLRVLDLREKEERARGPIPQAQAVAGKTLAERLKNARAMVTGPPRKGLAGRLAPPVTTVLIFPTASDPLPALERSFGAVPGDVRYMQGGYAAWAARPDKEEIGTVGACPICPGAKTGGKK